MTTDAPAGSSSGTTPETAGRYELREQLQSSVTGSTWRGYDHSADRFVDIRQLRPPAQFPVEQRRAMVARWARSAIRAQRAQLVGVVPVHDVLASDDELLVVTDVIDAPTVADLLRTEGRLPTERASAVAAAIAAVLQGLHDDNLVHGDLRPSRIRLSDDSLWLVTPGLISPDDDDPVPTLLTSPAYLSPQRARGARASAADDIWSLGVLIHAMVEGRPPFIGHSVDEVVDAIVNSPAPRCTSCSPALADAVDAMLDKDPERRPTAADVQTMLTPSDLAPAYPDEPERDSQAVVPLQDVPAAGSDRGEPGDEQNEKNKTPTWEYVVPLAGIFLLLVITAFVLSRL